MVPIAKTTRHHGAGDWLILLISLVFLFVRSPRALLHGFVFAEEGTVYLRYAWDAPVVRALLAPHQSYYSLYANVCGVIAARGLPLELAALFLAWSAIAVQLLMVYVVLRCEAFVTFRQKALAVAVCLLTVPTINVAFSTINAQFFLAICTAVILISDAGRMRVLRAAVLVLAGLTGVVSCILTPFAIWFAFRERSRARAVQAALLTACTIPQWMVVVHMSHVQARTLTPHSSLPFLLGAYLVNGPLFQFFTRWSGNLECRVLLSPLLGQWSKALWAVSEAAAVVALAISGGLMLRGGRVARRLGAMAIFSLAVGLSGALPRNEFLMCDSGARYFFLCNQLLGLGLVAAYSQTRILGAAAVSRWTAPKAAPLLGSLLLACLVISGVADVLVLWQHPPYVADWGSEVAHWRADSAHPIRIAPEFWKGLVLTPEHRSADLPSYVYDSNTPAQK